MGCTSTTVQGILKKQFIEKFLITSYKIFWEIMKAALVFLIFQVMFTQDRYSYNLSFILNISFGNPKH